MKFKGDGRPPGRDKKLTKSATPTKHPCAGCGHLRGHSTKCPLKPQHGGARAGAGWKRDAKAIRIGRFEIQAGAKVKAIVMNPDGSLAISAIFGTLSIHGRQIVVTLDWGETITIEAV